jgi:hypothetical protein
MAPLRTRLLAAAVLLAAAAACGGGGLGRQYEYDEQLYLNADGSASIVLNASVAALVALRGLELDPAPRARIDRRAVREMVAEPGLEITRVSRPWRRSGRQFIQIRAEIDDVTRLGETRLFGWTTYGLTTGPHGTREYRQMVDAPSGSAPPVAAWDGSELVAFKLHLPSRIRWHNARRLETDEPRSPERGNILTWEQRLTERVDGRPIDIQVSMDQGSILYRTLWLFGLSFGGAMALLGAAIWMVVRRGRRRAAPLTPR